MAGFSSAATVPLHTLLHLLPIKLSYSNYLIWKNQVSPLLAYQNLTGHIDGTLSSPPETIIIDGKICTNPDYATWKDSDEKVLLLLQSSLSEEAMAEIIVLPSARQVWLALEAAYSHHSLERMHTLRDTLRKLQKGSSTVSEYGRKFKLICDQLAAIGHPVDENDKCHWFLCGLGSAFETFSTAHRALPSSSFRDLLSKAENHELFMQAIHVPTAPQAAFVAQQPRSESSSRNFQGSSYSNRGRSRGSGRGRGRRPPHFQLCRKEGHYATACPSLSTFAQRAPTLDANLAQAFQAQCNVTRNYPDWHVDSGATAHMTPNQDDLAALYTNPGNDFVTFGNGQSLPVSKIGDTSITNKLPLRHVLVVPYLTKSLLSISRLTHDSPVDVLFSHNFFHIQDRKTKEVLA